MCQSEPETGAAVQSGHWKELTKEVFPKSEYRDSTILGSSDSVCLMAWMEPLSRRRREAMMRTLKEHVHDVRKLTSSFIWKGI